MYRSSHTSNRSLWQILPARRSLSFEREQGASLVEIVIGLPLVLAVILFLLWMVAILNARSGFQSAVVNGVRLAVTRGDSPLVGFHAGLVGGDTGLIPNLELWQAGTAALPDILYHGVDPADAEAYYNDILNKSCGTGFCGVVDGDFTVQYDAPRSYAYTLAYVYESVRKIVGESARFPCDPTEADGDGCIRCRFLHPFFSDDDTWGDDADEQVNLQMADLPANNIHLQCQAKVYVSILRPVFLLLSGTSADFGLMQYEVSLPLIGERPAP